METLLKTLRNRVKKSKSEFIIHYRDSQGSVPLWVLANDLTFGNIEHFFNLMKPREKDAVCKAISYSTERIGDKRLGFFSSDKARVCLEVLVKFRNICAHDERLYCASVGGRKGINYEKMIWMLERFLTPSEFYNFLKELTGLLRANAGQTQAIKHIINQIGFNVPQEKLLS